VYETDMAEGVKAMALEGHGIAFLPYSAVKKELRAKRLVSAAPSDMPALHITMDVRAYREKPVSHEPGRSTTRLNKIAPANSKVKPPVTKNSAQALWDYLSQPGAAP
jgi:DNA-binding transcriptional LysR family regulator